MTLTIDGREITVPDGTLIIRAAEGIGTYIPRFCDHPYLAPLGACRQCLVEVEGQRKPLTACTTPVTEGMIVKTQFTSEMAADSQEGVLELLLINHPLDCPMCDKGGECPLQDQALAYGPGGSRFIEQKRRFVKPVPISPLVYLDRERCVLCARCTRFADEISGDPFIELFERGALEQVAIFEDEPYESVFSGNVIQICPVGALTGSQFRFKARPFDMVSTPSVCNQCSSGCNTIVQTRRDQIVRVLAADNAEVNEVWSCDKGRFGFAYVQRPERISEPLVRKEGEFVAVSWAEAIRVVIERLDGAKRAGTPTAALSGGRLADEDAYALSRFARTVLGTNDIDQRMRAGSAEEDSIIEQVVSGTGTTYGDLEGAKAIVVVGSDLQQESPIVFLRVHKAATRRGAVVFEIGARKTALGGRTGARSVLCPPGTEAGVLLGIASELAARGSGGVDDTLRAAASGPNATTLARSVAGVGRRYRGAGRRACLCRPRRRDHLRRPAGAVSRRSRRRVEPVAVARHPLRVAAAPRRRPRRCCRRACTRGCCPAAEGSTTPPRAPRSSRCGAARSRRRRAATLARSSRLGGARALAARGRRSRDRLRGRHARASGLGACAVRRRSRSLADRVQPPGARRASGERLRGARGHAHGLGRSRARIRAGGHPGRRFASRLGDPQPPRERGRRRLPENPERAAPRDERASARRAGALARRHAPAASAPPR